MLLAVHFAHHTREPEHPKYWAMLPCAPQPGTVVMVSTSDEIVNLYVHAVEYHVEGGLLDDGSFCASDLPHDAETGGVIRDGCVILCLYSVATWSDELMRYSRVPIE